ncbi:MAG: hypothetical protein M3N98_02540 [Actinomycetota bacterium]|nr:hypothetical protein [Actinomycetota bacterium]
MSSGVLVARDQVAARTLGAQETAGDTTDYGFDVVAVTARPLNGGAADFIAYEKVRFHGTGEEKNIVELYHRDGRAALWKAVDRVYIADNIDLPALQLDTMGGGHLLSADEMTAQNIAQPEDLARRYATAVSVKTGSERLPAGSFQLGQFTSGEVTQAVDNAVVLSGVGTFSRQWEPHPGGEVVALMDGVLEFGYLGAVQVRHDISEGTIRYFMAQDQKRVNFGGLLAPGMYSDVTIASTVTVAVVVRPEALADVVGRDEQVLSAQGQLSPAP